MKNNIVLNKGKIHPIFALTMGDPAGIGPEITLKAMKNEIIGNSVVVIGDSSVLSECSKKIGSTLELNGITSIEDFRNGCINIFDCKILSKGAFTPGKVQKMCGMAAYKYIERSIEMALSGEVDGVITNPINKEALSLAGIQYPGHTEIFAEKTGTEMVTMVFYLHNIAVAHVTTHCSLLNAIKKISKSRICATIELLGITLKRLGVSSPRIAVGGLNPHAGENGLFGDEELLHIKPAIQQVAKKTNLNVSGPYPPDTVFMRAFRGEFDGIVSMLHDHGFVALKSMDFENGVNITIGLPIIRTSVGHGTAFDIAARGIANPTSLCAAHKAAIQLYDNRIRVAECGE